MSLPEIKSVAVESVGILKDAPHEGLSVQTGHIFDDWLTNIENRSSEELLQQSGGRSLDAASPPPREIAFEGTLRVNGYVAGVIRALEGYLIVDAGGIVDGDICVGTATIHGCVRGDIRAMRNVKLSSSAKVIGDIKTVELLIEPGAVFEGHCVFVQNIDDSSITE